MSSFIRRHPFARDFGDFGDFGIFRPAHYSLLFQGESGKMSFPTGAAPFILKSPAEHRIVLPSGRYRFL
jgi:hypothetical protein